MYRLFTAAKHGAVARFQAKRSRIGRDVGASLKYNGDDSERHRNFFDPKAVRPCYIGECFTDGVGQVGNLDNALCHTVYPVGREKKSVQKNLG